HRAGRESGVAQPLDVLASFDSTLGDLDHVLRDSPGEPLGSLKVDLKVAKSAVVDADDARAAVDGALELASVVHFHQTIAAEIVEDLDRFANALAVQQRRQQQDRVGARRNAAQKLPLVDD